MYNLIIVDDEVEIRNGLRHKLNWNEHGFQIAGEASNGSEALKLLEHIDVQLIITDIRMPIMDGLALLGELKTHYPKVRTIILSGYDDFSYVKIAMQNGVKDYLLKPVVRKELAEMLETLCVELDQEKQARYSQDRLSWKLNQSNALLLEHFMLELISEEYSDTADLMERIYELELDTILSENGQIRFLCAEMRIPSGRLGDEQGQVELMRSAYRMLCRETAQAYSSKVIAFPNMQIPNMLNFAVNYPDTYSENEQLKMFIHDLLSNIHKFLKVEAVIAVGQSVQGLLYSKDAYISSMLVWSQSQIGEQSQLIWYEPFSAQEVTFTTEFEKKLILRIESYDWVEVNEALRTLLTSEMYTLSALSQFVVKVYVLFDHVAKRHGIAIPRIGQLFVTIPDLIRKFSTVAQIIEHLSDIASELIELLKTNRATGGANVVQSVRAYIDANYAEEIGLTTLAEHFYINPTYLSELFKKNVGKTFSDYVIQIRIEKTEQLLHDPSLRLADIAELVGFSNASYLSNVFKKFHGVSPNEYRSKLKLALQ